jgi:hypothetical protein
MKKAPLFLAAALLVGSLLLVPLAPAYATTDLIPGQAAIGQLSDNQTAPTTDAVTPEPTTATTDTAPTTVVADTPTPAPATIIDTTAAPTADAVTPAPTTATTDTTPATVVADTPTPAPATTMDITAAPTTAAATPAPTTATTTTTIPTTAAVTPEPTTATTTTATPDSLPGQAAAGQLSDNQPTPSTADTEPPAPPPPPPAPATIITAPALPVTDAPEVGSTTGLSTAPAPAVTTPTPPADSNVLPPITQATETQPGLLPALTVLGTPPSGHHFPLPSDNGTMHFPPFPAPSDNGTVHFPHFPPSWDNSTVHFPHFLPSWDNSTAHFPPFTAPSDNGTAHLPPFPQHGHHPPYTPNPLPPQTNPTYPSQYNPTSHTYPYYPYDPEYTLSTYAPVIGSFMASPNYIQSGQAATLSWIVSGASVVTISPTVGSVTNTGSFDVMPTYTTTYTLNAYNSQGAVNASTIVTVTPYVSAYGGTYGTAVISSFTASPNYIQPGQPATLSWIVNNADTVTISPVVGPVANTGSFDVTPTYTTTYALSAYNGAGTISASATVTVAPDVSSYVTPAYAIGTGVNIDTDSSGTASGSTVNASQFINSIGNILNANGTSNSSTTAVDLWPMYLLLIGLAAVASVVITALLVTKPAVAHTQSTGMKTGYATSATAIITATQPATLTPMTTIVEIGLPAKFVSSGGITMPVAGRPLGRRDFRALISPDKADTISRQHILVTYENGVYYIEDPGSTNGTMLNGSEIKGSGKHTIENGDAVELAHALNLTFKV